MSIRTIGPPEAPDRFALIHELGSGSMGVVYEAFDRELRATVALKMLQERTPENLADLKREFRVVQSVLHPNLVRLGDLFQSAETWFFTMEYLRGTNYLGWLRSAGAPGVAEVHALGSSTLRPGRSGQIARPAAAPGAIADLARLQQSLPQLAAALVALHEAGLIHRDVKPSNVMITDAGRLVLLDFGLVRPMADDDPRAWTRAGTPAYMAPEQADDGVVTAAADCYAIGVLLYQALTGRPPFVGTIEDLLAQKRTWTPVAPRLLNPAAPIDLEELCLELLDPAPEARPTAAEIAARVSGKPSALRPSPGPRRRIFIGRTEELARIRTAMERAAGGHASVVVVTGESGIGKTSLIEEAVRRFERERDGALVMRGRCFEREVSAYAGVDMLVDCLVGHLKRMGDASASFVPTHAAALRQVFPTLAAVRSLAEAGEIAALTSSHETRARALAAFKELLARIAAHYKLVMVIDDAQWLSEESLVMLRSLLSDCDPVPLALVLAARSFEAERLAPWLDSLTCDLVRIALGPLSREESIALLHQHLGDREPQVLAAMAEDGAGHPYFLHELASASDDDPITGRARIDDVLWERAERLAPAPRELMELLCTAPRPIARCVLATAIAADDVELAISLRELAHRRWVILSPERLDSSVQPAHDRIRAALRPHIAPARATALQQRVAQAMELHAPDDVEALAMQWTLAGDVPRAAGYARDAAARAVGLLAFERAASLYELALEGTVGRGARAALLAARAGALVGAGHGAEAAHCYLDAAECSEAHDRDDLVVRAAEQLIRSGRLDEGKRVLGRVLENLGVRLPATPWAALTAVLRKRIALRIRGTRPRCLTAEQRRALLRRIDACWSVGDLIAVIDPLRAASLHGEGLLRALDVGEPSRLARLLCTDAIFVSMPAGRTRAAAESRLAWARELAAPLEAPELAGYLALGAGVVRLHCGELATAQVDLDRAEAIFERCPGTHWETNAAREFALWTLAYRGEFVELARRLDPAIELARGRGDRPSLIKLLSGPSHVILLARDDARRLHTIGESSAAELAQDEYPFLHLCGLFARAHASMYLGRAGDALEDLAREHRRIRAAQLHRSQFFRVDLAALRGRAAMGAMADGTVVDRERLRRVVRESIEGLRREHVAWASALAEMIDALLGVERSPAADAIARLAGAARQLDEAGLGGYAAAVRWQCRRFAGPGAATPTASDSIWSDPAMIARPERLAQTLAPLPMG